jgi:2-keto-3-deoxy-L-rhamnonate aldolase RhmA
MIHWFKSLFGFANEVVTLNDRHAKASRIAQSAIATFDGVILDLEHAAHELKDVAAQAIDQASALTARATAAADEAIKHEARAAKIRDLVA